MTKYHRMTFGEREKVYQLLQTNHNQTFIARQLGRNKSSISRELGRCTSDPLGYIPDRAQKISESFLRRNRKIFRSKKLSASVISFLQEGWSPEQISGRLKLENKGTPVVSHETIYQFIYTEESQAQKLYLLLTRHKPKRTKWYSRKPRQSHIPESANIKHRPKIIEKRKSIGHWEGDLVVFGSLKGANVTTLVERKSRFAQLVYNRSKYTDEVIGGIAKTMSGLPNKRVKTITFDRGTEFASFRKLGVTTYFCNPHSPWQKGGDENYNGRLRKYLPKKFDHRNLSQDLLDNIEDKMNNQPRKCLGFRSPAEVFHNRKLQYVALDP
jgi:IS30 family transposase